MPGAIPVVGEFKTWDEAATPRPNWDPRLGELPEPMIFEIVSVTPVAEVGPWPFNGSYLVGLAPHSADRCETYEQAVFYASDLDLKDVHYWGGKPRLVGEAVFDGMGTAVTLNNVRVNRADRGFATLKAKGAVSTGNAYIDALTVSRTAGSVVVKSEDGSDNATYNIWLVTQGDDVFSYTAGV